MSSAVTIKAEVTKAQERDKLRECLMRLQKEDALVLRNSTSMTPDAIAAAASIRRAVLAQMVTPRTAVSAAAALGERMDQFERSNKPSVPVLNRKQRYRADKKTEAQHQTQLEAFRADKVQTGALTQEQAAKLTVADMQIELQGYARLTPHEIKAEKQHREREARLQNERDKAMFHEHAKKMSAKDKNIVAVREQRLQYLQYQWSLHSNAWNEDRIQLRCMLFGQLVRGASMLWWTLVEPCLKLGLPACDSNFRSLKDDKGGIQRKTGPGQRFLFNIRVPRESYLNYVHAWKPDVSVTSVAELEEELAQANSKDSKAALEAMLIDLRSYDMQTHFMFRLIFELDPLRRGMVPQTRYASGLVYRYEQMDPEHVAAQGPKKTPVLLCNGGRACGGWYIMCDDVKLCQHTDACRVLRFCSKACKEAHWRAAHSDHPFVAREKKTKEKKAYAALVKQYRAAVDACNELRDKDARAREAAQEAGQSPPQLSDREQLVRADARRMRNKLYDELDAGDRSHFMEDAQWLF